VRGGERQGISGFESGDENFKVCLSLCGQDQRDATCRSRAPTGRCMTKRRVIMCTDWSRADSACCAELMECVHPH
jgi:hypothetical protein